MALLSEMILFQRADKSLHIYRKNPTFIAGARAQKLQALFSCQEGKCAGRCFFPRFLLYWEKEFRRRIGRTYFREEAGGIHA